MSEKEKLAFYAGVVYACSSMGMHTGDTEADVLMLRVAKALGITGMVVSEWIIENKDYFEATGLVKRKEDVS